MVDLGWRELSLFTGSGGGLYASKILGWKTVCAVEWNKYCQKVLRARQADGWFDEFPIYDDVFKFDGNPWRGRVDVLSAGFPCQPFSVAGKQFAGDDPKNGWPHTARIIREVQPRFVWLENVPGLITGKHGYFGTVLSDLHNSGYDAVWRVVSAQQVGALHRRRRLWIFAFRREIMANTVSMWKLQQSRRVENSSGGSTEPSINLSATDRKQPITQRFLCGEHMHGDAGFSAVGFNEYNGDNLVHQRGYGGCATEVRRDPSISKRECNPWGYANTYEERRQKYGQSLTPCSKFRPTGRTGAWAVEPRVDRMAHGVANGRNRIEALGNGQVPQQMVAAFLALYNDMLDSMS